MPLIPGHATEIRYRRTGPLAGRYVHRFRPGVRMRANADGSVTLRGRRPIHATEDEAGFWEKYGHRDNPPRPTHQAFCLRCLGGGKFLGRPGSKRSAEFEATSHGSAYGHDVTILPAKNPRRWSRSRARAPRHVVRVTVTRPPEAFPWGWIFAGVLFWAWSAQRATGAVSEPMPGRSIISLSDTVRTMQADAEALTASSASSPYTSLSDYLRSGPEPLAPGEPAPYTSLSDRLRSGPDVPTEYTNISEPFGVWF